MSRMLLPEWTQEYLFKLIQFQQANGKVITNAMLEELIQDIMSQAIFTILPFPYSVASYIDREWRYYEGNVSKRLTVEHLEPYQKDCGEYISQSICQALEKGSFELKPPKGWDN
jgi:hypothetical protein